MNPIMAKRCAATHAPELIDWVAPPAVDSSRHGRVAGYRTNSTPPAVSATAPSRLRTADPGIRRPPRGIAVSGVVDRSRYRLGMVDPTLLASGRDADVFAIDAGRVLRRYRTGGDVAAEARVMTYVAGFGFPVPAVYEAHGTDLVMERLDGPTMLSALVAGDLALTEAAALLADLHGWLHQLPPRTSADPTARVLHLDLHPDNVVLSPRGPVVIDWRNATEGPADLDIALSAVIFAEVAVDDTHDMAGPAVTLLTEFLRRAGGEPLSALDRAVAIRRANPTLTPPRRRAVPVRHWSARSAGPATRSRRRPARTPRPAR